MFCPNTGTKFREPYHLNHVIPRPGMYLASFTIKLKYYKLKGMQSKVHDACEVSIENVSLGIFVGHYSTRLLMPNSDPCDGFFLFTAPAERY